MDRLTNKRDNLDLMCRYLATYTAFDAERIKAVYNRLLQYEDAEEQGRFVMLPCKVGDIVWTNFCVSGDYFRTKDKPYSCEVIFVGLNGEDGFINVQYKNGRQHQFLLRDIDKTVFLTREEAEKSQEEHQ